MFLSSEDAWYFQTNAVRVLQQRAMRLLWTKLPLTQGQMQSLPEYL